MNIKRIMLAGILVIVFGICGCGNKEKIDSNEEYSAEGISEIVLDISSWNLKVLASSDDKVHMGTDFDVCVQYSLWYHFFAFSVLGRNDYLFGKICDCVNTLLGLEARKQVVVPLQSAIRSYSSSF